MRAYNLRRVALLAVASSVLLGAGAAEAGLKIYYIRHAEGGHNVKADWVYRKVPEDQWPAYVGNHEMFTPKGLVQQAAVAGKLKGLDIDFIATSTAWRSRNTILPFLKETDAKAEVWPELHELGADAQILSDDLPVPTTPILGAGDPVKVPAAEAAWFSLRKGGENEFKVPRRGHSPEAAKMTNAAARVIIQRVVDMIEERFAGTDSTILLSGHGSSGKAVLRMLTKEPLDGFPNIANTGIWMVEEQADGGFKPVMFNGFALENGKPSAASKHAAMDTNGDGKVTKAEYVGRHAAGFGRKDKDKDGALSEEEHNHSSFEDADVNQDKKLSPEEYASVFEEQFDKSHDKNGDGVCTLEEMKDK
ncbi:histidine phosphatase family protein [Haloferula sp.]|uniref:histidine phosphatase family protein n=1 Tax=Haloferula sp. TaxID=2497595 RepID=UPI00329BCA1C